MCIKTKDFNHIIINAYRCPHVMLKTKDLSLTKSTLTPSCAINPLKSALPRNGGRGDVAFLG
jgi:hypothetical protein